MSESGCDGVMIGRGAEGRPWRLAEISNAVFGTPYHEPTAAEKLESMLNQIANSAELYGEKLGVRVVRKHVAAFVDAWCEDYGLAPMAEARVALCRIESPTMLRDELVAALSGRRDAA